MSKIILAVLLVALIFPIFSFGFLQHRDPTTELLRRYPLQDSLVSPVEDYFDNLINHFDPTDLRTYKQRFFSADDFFDENDQEAPVFLYVGCEGPISGRWAQQGLMYDWAKKLGAMMFILEHRYYGDSQPMPSWSLDNLKYLTTEQALADLAAFVTSFPKLRNRPWIVFGGSYGGSLVAWARYKYPSLIHGAVSASGVFYPKIDFHEYLEVANDALEYYGGKSCQNNFFNATRAMSDLIKSGPVGRDTVSKKFKLCQPLTGKEQKLEMMSFWAAISDTFAGVVQYNRENDKTRMNVKGVCDMLDESKNDYFEGLSKVYQRYLDENAQPCVDWTLDAMIRLLSKTEIEYNQVYRTWIYQTCSAYGFYQTSTTVRTFGDEFNMEFFEYLCMTAYSKDYSWDNIKIHAQKIINTYSALDFRSSNVIFTNGNIDPWHAVSILKENADLFNYNHFIMGTSHCAPLYPESPNDPKTLRDARQRMFEQILLILDNFHKTVV